MRQVPAYLLIGNGCVAKHFQHYFSLLELPFQTWCRQESLDELSIKSVHATHILLLIKDDAINGFIQEHSQLFAQKILLHFSGSLNSAKAYGCHPLMTFGSNLYDLSHYQSIPFVIDQHAPDFSTLLPGLSHPYVRLHESLKAKYHALCVLSGNFSCLLWQHFFKCLENELHIPSEIAFPYLQQQMKNILQSPETALTGPLVRNDRDTIVKNLAALEGDPFKQVYQSFVSSYHAINNDEKAGAI